MQEIIGSAIAFQVLFGLPLWVGCLITLVDTFTFLGVHYFGVRKLEAVFVALVRWRCRPLPSDAIIFAPIHFILSSFQSQC
jgi:NRAMP (natural resistance-associated macrophage protein)-like metal ion transporter